MRYVTVNKRESFSLIHQSHPFVLQTDVMYSKIGGDINWGTLKGKPEWVCQCLCVWLLVGLQVIKQSIKITSNSLTIIICM